MDFISWNDSQRSRMLSMKMEARYFLFSPRGGFLIRQALCFGWTIWLLAKTRPVNITIQYSFLLLLLARVYQHISTQEISIICDCHTKALRRLAPMPFTNISLWLKRNLFKGVNHVFVHTPELIPEALALNKSCSVLIDPIPDAVSFQERNDNKTIVFVCSFSQDEPIDCILAAAKLLSKSCQVHITGNMPVSIRENLAGMATISTGYLDREEYQRLLARSGVIIGLTTEDQCLQCSGYEALALAKPYVTSNTTALRALFGKAALYSSHNPQLLANTILQAMENSQFYRGEMKSLSENLRNVFSQQINVISTISLPSNNSAKVKP